MKKKKMATAKKTLQTHDDRLGTKPRSRSSHQRVKAECARGDLRKRTKKEDNSRTCEQDQKNRKLKQGKLSCARQDSHKERTEKNTQT